MRHYPIVAPARAGSLQSFQGAVGDRAAAAADRSRRLFQAEPLKCQRLVGSGRQTATACRLHPGHFGFLREGERFSPSVSVTRGHQRLLALDCSHRPPVWHQEETGLVSGRPTGLALGAGMAKSCRASPTRFDLKEEFACALRSSPECRRPLPRTSAANQRKPTHGGYESARNARPRRTGGQPCFRARGAFSPRP